MKSTANVIDRKERLGGYFTTLRKPIQPGGTSFKFPNVPMLLTRMKRIRQPAPAHTAVRRTLNGSRHNNRPKSRPSPVHKRLFRWKEDRLHLGKINRSLRLRCRHTSCHAEESVAQIDYERPVAFCDHRDGAFQCAYNSSLNQPQSVGGNFVMACYHKYRIVPLFGSRFWTYEDHRD